jgi:hypothetical protein
MGRGAHEEIANGADSAIDAHDEKHARKHDGKYNGKYKLVSTAPVTNNTNSSTTVAASPYENSSTCHSRLRDSFRRFRRFLPICFLVLSSMLALHGLRVWSQRE